MFHGRKKQAARQPSEEEIKANGAKLEKIMIINKQMLKKRNEQDYSKEAFAQTEKFSYLSPDFYTLWNYRREIITQLFLDMDTQERLNTVKLELELLLKGISRSPKSYTLWFHRQWTIELGLKEEAKAAPTEWKS
jgi:geranylgeranyl transferase type-2 subunit alpha